MTITPISLPTQTPRPTLAGVLPDGLPAIRPENIHLLRPLARLGQEGGFPYSDIAFSPQGQFLAAIACDQALTLWEAASNLPLPVPTAEAPAACQGSWKLAFSPAGYLLASTAQETTAQGLQNVVQLWTVSSGFGAQRLHKLPAGSKPVTSLAFSPDGRILAAGTQGNVVKLWFISDPADPLATPITELGELPLSDWAVGVDFSPDGRWLAAGTAEYRGGHFEPSIFLWSVHELLKVGAREAPFLAVLTAKSGPLRQVGFSPDGRLLAAAGDGVTLWETGGDQTEEGRGAENAHIAGWNVRAFLEMPTSTFCFSPDGRLLVAGGQNLLAWEVPDRWDTETTGELEWNPLGQLDEEIAGLVFAPAGHALAVLSVEGTMTLWGILR